MPERLFFTPNCWPVETRPTASYNSRERDQLFFFLRLNQHVVPNVCARNTNVGADIVKPVIFD
jgi:hypothetical protein